MAKRTGVESIDVKALYYFARQRITGPDAKRRAWRAVENALTCDAVVDLMWGVLHGPLESRAQVAALNYIANPTLALKSMRKRGRGHPDRTTRRPRRRWRAPR